MFCKMSENMNVNKDRVEQYSMVCFSDSIEGSQTKHYREIKNALIDETASKIL